MAIVAHLRLTRTARLAPWLPAMALLVATAANAGDARAEPRDARADAAARAKALVAEANRLLASVNVEEACNKLREAEALAPSAATLMHLASCEEALGRTATALAAYRRARAMSGRELRGAKARALQQRIQKLEAATPSLVVVASPEALGVKDLAVQACGASLEAGDLGAPLPKDPGPCEITAKAPGFKPWTKTITLAPRGGRTEVVVPALEAEAPAETAQAPATEAPPEPPVEATPEPPRESPGPDKERTVTGIALLGLGAGLAATGTYFGVAAMRSEKDADARCPRTTCDDPVALRANDRAITQGELATLTVSAGAVALVAGAFVLLTHPAPASKSASRGVYVVPGAGGGVLGGTF
jgi:hypothetical protein